MKGFKVAVLGANGQLGQSIKDWYTSHKPDKEWVFFSSSALDITDKKALAQGLDNSFNYVINCAAYTAVDRAEQEIDKAQNINTTAVENLAKACRQKNITLLHISTDFVFDGNRSRPYKETDQPQPLGVYGKTKYQGEKLIAEHLHQYFILRTGWLYSSRSKNFLTTIHRLSQEREALQVVCDQVGTPTHVQVLIKIIVLLIARNSKAYGCYHVANEGVASWYDFAYEILQLNNSSCTLYPIPTKEYPTPAQRPAYSVLDKTKIKAELNLHLPHWKENLKDCF